MTARPRRLFIDTKDALALLAGLDGERGLELPTLMPFRTGDDVDIVARAGAFEITVPARVKARRATSAVVFGPRHAPARRSSTVRRMSSALPVSAVVAADAQIATLCEILLAGGGINVDGEAVDGVALFAFRGVDGRARLTLRGERRGGVFRLAHDRGSRRAARAFAARALCAGPREPLPISTETRAGLEEALGTLRRALALARTHAFAIAAR